MENSLKLRAHWVARSGPPIKLQHLQWPEHDRQVRKLLEVGRVLRRQNEGLAKTSVMVMILVPSLTVLIFVLNLVVWIFGLSLRMFSVVLSLMVFIFVLSLRVLFGNSAFASRASGSAWGLMGAEEILLRLHRSSLHHGCPFVRQAADGREVQVLANLIEHLRHPHPMCQGARALHIILGRLPPKTRLHIWVNKPEPSLILRLMSRLALLDIQNPILGSRPVCAQTTIRHGCGWAPPKAGDSNCGRMMHSQIKYDAHRLRAHDAHKLRAQDAHIAMQDDRQGRPAPSASHANTDDQVRAMDKLSKHSRHNVAPVTEFAHKCLAPTMLHMHDSEPSLKLSPESDSTQHQKLGPQNKNLLQPPLDKTQHQKTEIEN